MPATLTTPTAPAAAPTQSASVEKDGAPPQHLLLRASWALYEQINEEITGQGLRATYVDGELEIMVLSREHEEWKTIVARLLEQLALELDIPLHGAGGFTMKMEALEKGGEPDECYYLGTPPKERSVTQGANAPTPDLVIEVDLTRRWVARRPIYAAMGVPELWCYHDGRLEFLHLDASGAYRSAAQSLGFPMLTAADLQPFIEMAGKQDQHAMLRALRQWARQRR